MRARHSLWHFTCKTTFETRLLVSLQSRYRILKSILQSQTSGLLFGKKFSFWRVLSSVFIHPQFNKLLGIRPCMSPWHVPCQECTICLVTGSTLIGATRGLSTYINVCVYIHTHIYMCAYTNTENSHTQRTHYEAEIWHRKNENFEGSALI